MYLFFVVMETVFYMLILSEIFELLQLMNELLCGIRVVKFYSWESHFTSRINDLREKELYYLKGRKYLDALCVYFWATTPVLISILTFTTYVLMGDKLTAAKVRSYTFSDFPNC